MPHPSEESEQFLETFVFLATFAGAVVAMHHKGDIKGLAENLPNGEDAVKKVEAATRFVLPFILRYTVKKIAEDGLPPPDIITPN
jgi:hypothetical protein